jgi:hypothetical protein
LFRAAFFISRPAKVSSRHPLHECETTGQKLLVSAKDARFELDRPPRIQYYLLKEWTPKFAAKTNAAHRRETV